MTGADDQAPVVRALADAGFYPHRPATVTHVQTHISHVFLAGPFVYKMKKAVRFPFLDFSTRELRAHFAGEEVRLNRRLCPEVYLDVVPVVRRDDGRLSLGGSGEPIEHVVRMRRLPADRLLVALLARDAVRPADLAALAALLARFHADAPHGPDVARHATPEAIVARWRDNLAGTMPVAGVLLRPEDRAVLDDFGPSFVARHEKLLRARVAAGRVRDGHGDLHAEHVCFADAPVPGPPGLPPLAAGIYVFDCIEFSPAFRANDVASEVAFLAMDLTALGRADLAGAFVDAYVAASRDPDVARLVPFYACHRAIIRGKVEGLASVDATVDAATRADAADRARRHFALAVRYAWQAAGPAVIACTGLSGSGKSTLARALAETTGFALVGSDAIRRRDASGPPSYTRAARDAVYARLFDDVAAALRSGRAVVADATFARRADRDRLAALARAEGRPWVFLECRADEDEIRARLAAREASPGDSDARWDVYVAQKAAAEPLRPDEPHGTVDTTSPRDVAHAAACRLLWPWRQRRPLDSSPGGAPGATRDR